MYVTATNGTTTNALVAAADGASATATYTVDLAAPTIGEITYMAAGTNSATGGHNYARYEANGTTYGSDSFYITATANSNAAAADAWNEWAAGVTSTTRPKINIIYTVANKTDGPTITSGATTIASPDSDGATYSVNLVSGTASNIAFNLPTGYSISTVYANGDPSNLTTTNDSIVTYSGNTVTLKGNSSWASASAGTIKYIKVVTTDGTNTTNFIIKVVCNPE